MSQTQGLIRVAVVGYGFGRFHVKTLAGLSGVRLVAVADRQSTELDAAASQYGFRSYRDAVKMLDQEQLDALVIAIPPKHRRPLIQAAVSRQIAMFIEKPWASNREQAQGLAALCADSKKPVMVGFSFRFHPAIVKLRELLNTELGRPRMLSGEYVFECPVPKDNWLWAPDNGNGFINENSCHLFDAACYLLGRPVRVFAEAGRFTNSPMYDAATVTLRFQGGAIASLCCGAIGTSAFDDYPRIRLHTEHGQAELVGQNHVWHGLKWAMQGQQATRRFVAPPEQMGSTRYTHAVEHFIRCIRDNKPTTATIQDAVLSVEIAMAVAESARTGRTVDLATDLEA